jgi:GT2 family glycosyltransferase/SAM-dependent methyltransferase
VNSLEGQIHRLAQFPIPADLHGKRVLDIGAWDGWFSFEMERRGAEVVAIDVWDNPRFHHMHELLGSRVDYRVMDVYDLSPARVGRFDIVLLLAVLYHLKHPLLALERVCAVTTDLAAVESFALMEEHRPGASVDTRPIMEFYESDEFGGMIDNWVGPSLPALMAFCRTAGFARVELRTVLPNSACVACYRRWADDLDESRPPPRLTAAFHKDSKGISFSSERDEYVTVRFESLEESLGRDLVRPEVGGFGTRPIQVGRRPDGTWQAIFKLPPGLEAGWHPVQIRVKNSRPSNSIEVAVDLAVPDQPVAVDSEEDELWTPAIGEDAPNVAVVVVNHNAGERLLECLASVFASAGDATLEVFVVDNASTDGSARRALGTFPEVRLVENPGDRGFGAAVNQGIERSRAPFVFVLHPEAVVSSGTLGALVKLAQERPRTGAIGTLIRNPDGIVVLSGRRFPTVGQAVGHALIGPVRPDNRFSRAYALADWDRSTEREVDWVPMSSMLLRRDALDDVGLLDERFSQDGGELDMCTRLRNADWQVLFTPEVEVVPEGGVATDRSRGMHLLHSRDMYLYFAKHRAAGWRMALLPFAWAAFRLRAEVAALRDRA